MVAVLDADAVKVFRSLRFAFQVERLRGSHLHAVGHLKAGDSGIKLRFAVHRVIELAQKIELCLLAIVAEIWFQIGNRLALKVERSSLERSRQESCAPILSRVFR